MLDPQQVLTQLNFGKVDGETDNRFHECFIGTEMLRQVVLPQHSLVVGNKGSGKSAICRLLVDDFQRVKPLLPRGYNEIFCIPAYGLQSEENIPGVELRELKPETVDDFRNFWMVYLGLKVASTLLKNNLMILLVEHSDSQKVRDAWKMLRNILLDVGLLNEKNLIVKIQHVMHQIKKSGLNFRSRRNGTNTIVANFKDETGVSIIAMMQAIDTILRGTNCLAWIMLDKLDLLFVDDIQKLRSSIAGLVQLLVQYGNELKNIHFKIFLRNDIYRQLHIVNKSHLVTYTVEMKWRNPLLLKLLVSRAVVDPHVKQYCEEKLGEKIDVSDVIIGSDEFAEKIFYTIFEPRNGNNGDSNISEITTHQYILKRLIDGTGSSFPRELIHLGNRAVEKQREMNRIQGSHTSTKLISFKALKEAFAAISQYRCDTYLYSEFPHLAKHFDVFRGSDSPVFHREELYMLFEPLNPKGDEAIRAVYDAGLITPLGNNVDSCRKFVVPLLYRPGMGITERRRKTFHTSNVNTNFKDMKIVG